MQKLPRKNQNIAAAPAFIWFCPFPFPFFQIQVINFQKYFLKQKFWNLATTLKLSRYLFVHMSVCLSHLCASPRKVKETENFDKSSCQKNYKADGNTFSHADANALLSKAKLSYVYTILKTHFEVSSTPQSQSRPSSFVH